MRERHPAVELTEDAHVRYRLGLELMTILASPLNNCLLNAASSARASSAGWFDFEAMEPFSAISTDSSNSVETASELRGMNHPNRRRRKEQ